MLKDAKDDSLDTGWLMEYLDDETTYRYRRDLRSINKWLGEARIDFDEGALMSEKWVDPNERLLRRIFTRGSFESGGRLFDGFWQNLKKIERAEGIEIEGERVVTLDFGQMAPRILYDLVNEQPPTDDLYLLPDLEIWRKGCEEVNECAALH